ncbi:hypothetical protein [Hyphomicrobium sp.]|uniref:ORC-CDC6 family AAA ATPase n=1 Tax=Hyphomicrobium sp. TaxID=82 RepID=UPI0025C06722|nr:hypothetical protein [Hyphomicrobium sp.]MCC7253629.1 hypothetical protein [Hyphomicrobium sp.]
MAYRANPFLERMSERTTSDQEFVRLFSPRILERIEDDAFDGAVHVFRSAPGAGKTTLFRAFTPNSLRGFWRAQNSPEIAESYRRLASRGLVHDEDGPQLLGVLLSCASGYADLPPGSAAEDGLFRALFDCRIVLRTLRSLAALVGSGSEDSLSSIHLQYDGADAELSGIPRLNSAAELAGWAAEHEKRVYAKLDAFSGREPDSLPGHVRFEGVLWLQVVRFVVGDRVVAPRRLLMVDDVWKLRRRQRQLLIDELTVLRPSIPVWFGLRSSALGESLLSQGARSGRDLREYALEEIWGGTKAASYQFVSFAQNVLDKRMNLQNAIPGANFQQCLRQQLEPEEIRRYLPAGIKAFGEATAHQKSNVRYSEWLARAERKSAEPSLDTLLDLYVTRIIMSRDAARRQMSFDLALPAEELEDRDNSQVRNAAEIFLHEELDLPHYYGFERLCVMASSNIEELLSLAAALYEGVEARQVLRRRDPELSPAEQEKQLLQAAKRKLQFIPKSHTEGTRALRLLQSIGSYCRERTFLPNAPYAPGVTGVRLSHTELDKLSGTQPMGDQGRLLLRGLAECVAENLLLARPSSASTAREAGTIFDLNRTLCAHFGLPLQMGGWQDVESADLADWVARGRTPDRMRLQLG